MSSDFERRFGFEDESWLAWSAQVNDELVRPDSSLKPLDFGHYSDITEIGRGGQGIVYRATDRRTQQTVALKRMLGGTLASVERRERFRREVEAIAQLDHVGIVRLHGLDVVNGHPVIAMQWVDGVPLNKWLESRPVRQRGIDALLQIFEQVGAAVAHAHRRGFIHRDIKPSNILVDENGEPHLLDLGLAKRLDGGEENDESLTAGFVGTLRYAPPEQLEPGAMADTPADVYSLGVVMYEAFAGRHPFGGRPPQPGALPERIRAPRAGVDPDLEAIILKTIRTDPDQRYQGANELLLDLERRRSGLPVNARPPQLGYQLRKLVARHPVGAGITAAGLAAVILFLGYANWKDRAIARQRDLIQRNAERLNEVVQLLLVDVLQAPDGFREPSVALAAINRASRRARKEVSRSPEITATLLHVIGDAYAFFGEWVDAEDSYSAGLGLLPRATPEDGLLHSQLLAGLAKIALHERDFERGRELLGKAMQGLDPELPLQRAQISAAWRLRAELELGEGTLDEADACLDAALRETGGQPRQVEHQLAETESLRGRIALARGEPAIAEKWFQEAVARRTSATAEGHIGTAVEVGRLGEARLALGKSEPARAALAHALHSVQRAWGPDHRAAIDFAAILCRAHMACGDAENGLGLATETLRRLERTGDWLHPRVEELEALLAEHAQVAAEALGREGQARTDGSKRDS